jgi:hypothetical protein
MKKNILILIYIIFSCHFSFAQKNEDLKFILDTVLCHSANKIDTVFFFLEATESQLLYNLNTFELKCRCLIGISKDKKSIKNIFSVTKKQKILFLVTKEDVLDEKEQIFNYYISIGYATKKSIKKEKKAILGPDTYIVKIKKTKNSLELLEVTYPSRLNALMKGVAIPPKKSGE